MYGLGFWVGMLNLESNPGYGALEPWGDNKHAPWPEEFSRHEGRPLKRSLNSFGGGGLCRGLHRAYG